MANQRIFIRCKACGAEKFLAKRLGSAFRTLDQTMDMDKWDDFFEEHMWGFCDPNGGEYSLDVFELSYEHHVKGTPSQSDGRT